MSQAVEKILEKVPYFDGGFRRRVTSGSIIVVILFLYLGSDIDTYEFFSGNFTILIIAFLVIYAIGSLVELLADVLISNLIERFSNFQILKSKKEKSLDISILLDEQGYKYFKSLPNSVRRGFENPYGKYREVSWNYFSNIGSIEEIELALKLRSRNQDVLVIVTTISFSLFFLATPFVYDLYVGYGDYSQQQSQTQSAEVAGYLAITIILGLCSAFPTIFFSAYLSSVKNSVQTLLQYKALVFQEGEINLNNSIQVTTNTQEN